MTWPNTESARFCCGLGEKATGCQKESQASVSWESLMTAATATGGGNDIEKQKILDILTPL